MKTVENMDRDETARPTSEAPMPRLRFARLRFSDGTEPIFSAYYFRQSLPFMRFAIVLAIVLYALFGLLDVFMIPTGAASVGVIRYAVVCPVAIVVLGLTFTRQFESIAQLLLSALAAVCGLGIVAIIAIAPASAGLYYYAGLLLVVPWAYSVLRLRFVYATGAAIMILIGYEVVAVWAKQTPWHILINNNFFFVSSVILGMVAGYTIERSMRTDFVQRRVIEAQSAELAERNVHLDSALQLSLEELQDRAEELQASRARVVAAADAERRRIERNLHDGAQQSLVALAVQLRLASKLADQDVGAASALLGKLGGQVQEAVDELRNLAHGIYPPVLMDQGLAAALVAAARRMTLPTTVEAEALRRHPAEVEATVYFCCLESLQNATKHAGPGASVTVRVTETAAELVFEVIDDGVGFQTRGRGLGAGFVNMRDRLGAVGGSLAIRSEIGEGTTVSGWVPLPAEGSAGTS